MPDAPADEIAGITPAHAGKGWRSSVRPKGDGITPAHAGKRDDALIDGLIHEDHPRMCGEKRKDRLDYSTCRRDHPRVCGEKNLHIHLPSYLYRITPACAGKSLLFGSFQAGRWDHPRMCGEKVKSLLEGIT